MAVRPIDGNELLDIERLLDTDVVRQSKTASWLLDQVLHDIQAMPTLTPPEIVCCQDCVHHEDGYAHWCNKWEHTCPDDSEFFCKFGRKKNDSTTD